MDAETIKRLKDWFLLRLPPEDWTQFGSSAEQVLRTFDNDPDGDDALLRFAQCVIFCEAHKLGSPRLFLKRLRELRKLLGIAYYERFGEANNLGPPRFSKS